MANGAELPITAKFATIVGRVQGVGFRWSAYEEAQRAHISGWVRNAADGSVEVYMEGPPSAVEAFSSWLRKGPPGSRVDSVKLRDAVPTGAYRRFVIEH